MTSFPLPVKRECRCQSISDEGRCFWCEELLVDGATVMIHKRSGAVESCLTCAFSIGIVMVEAAHSAHKATR